MLNDIYPDLMSDGDIDLCVRLLGEQGEPEDDLIVRVDHYERLVRTIDHLRKRPVTNAEYRALNTHYTASRDQEPTS